MKKIVETSASENKMGLIQIIKGIGIAYILTFLLLFIFSVLLTYTNISENMIAPVILIITVISILIGSSISSNQIKKNGIINGGMIGFLYIIILYLISSFTRKWFCIKFIFYFNDCFFSIGGNDWWNCWSKPKKIIDKVELV